MRRPAVDVVVPFVGSLALLDQLANRLAVMRLRADDCVLIVDNTPGRGARGFAQAGTLPVLRAAERRTPGYARNQGAASGGAEWLVFLDADTEPSPDLLDCYFDPPPGDATALIGGGVRDEQVASGSPPAARYQYLRANMSQDRTFALGPWSFPVTANVAVRRAAFEAIGGFREDIRAAEDADLTYRLRAAGWKIERREAAAVVHSSRQSVRSFITQKALHGSGQAWLERHYDCVFEARKRRSTARAAGRRILAAARAGDRDALLVALLGPVERIAWQLGRSLSNERPLAPRSLRAR